MESNGLIVCYLILPPEGNYEFTLGSTPFIQLHKWSIYLYQSLLSFTWYIIVLYFCILSGTCGRFQSCRLIREGKWSCSIAASAKRLPKAWVSHLSHRTPAPGKGQTSTNWSPASFSAPWFNNLRMSKPEAVTPADPVCAFVKIATNFRHRQPVRPFNTCVCVQVLHPQVSPRWV